MKKILFQIVFFLAIGPCSILFSQSIDWKPIVSINSDYDEFSPSISPDGQSLIFSSARPGGLGDNDIWISRKTENEWSKPENLRTMNSRWHDHEPCFSHDGNYILFSSDRDGSYGTGDIYISYRKGENWSAPQNMGPSINTKNSEKMPSLSMNNSELYFTRIPVNYSKGIVEVEKRQLYMSKRTGNSWSTPKMLEQPVNQYKLESASRILADGLTLLFCSAREGGKGNYDLWKAERENPTSPWSKVTNLSDINTEFSEVYFGTDLSGKTLFLASNRNPRGNFDIYTATLEEEMIDPTVTLQGIVSDSDNGKPLESEIIVELFEGKKVIPFSITSDKESGKYSITLPKGSRYSITAEKEGYLFFSRELNLNNIEEAQTITEEIQLHPLKAGEKVVFKTIYFVPDSAQLLPESFPALQRLLELMQNNSELRIRIEGHVADVGVSQKEAMKLSLQRAEAVRKYLIRKDIGPERLEIMGLGGTVPIGDNSIEEGRKLNRRTEIEIIK